MFLKTRNGLVKIRRELLTKILLTPFLCRFKCKQSISASVGGNFHFINKVLTTPRLRRLPLESLVTALFILKISASCNVFFHIFDQAAFFNERQNVEEKNKQCILTDVFKNLYETVFMPGAH